jgi:hypothetical protein
LFSVPFVQSRTANINHEYLKRKRHGFSERRKSFVFNMFRSSRNELCLVEASSKRWQYFSIRVTHRSQLGGPLDGGEAAIHYRPQLPTTAASSAYENNTASSVITSRIDGVANLVERYCAANTAV